MKKLTRALVVVLLLAMVLTLMPALEEPASAASVIPVISFTNDKTYTDQDPFMDFHLSKDVFGTYGPYVISYDVKVDGAGGWTKNDGEPYPSIKCRVHSWTSLTYNQEEQAKINHYEISDQGWKTVTMEFDNVGWYGVSGTNVDGGLFRIEFWQTYGTISIRNFKISKKNDGTVLYDMNTDSVIQTRISQMQASGLTSTDLATLADVEYTTKWTAPGSFTSIEANKGRYWADLILATGTTTTTSSSSTKATSSSSTKATSSSSTKATSSSNTVKPSQNPCAGGHTYVEGTCTVCGAVDSNYIPPSSSTEATSSSTQATSSSVTTAPSTQQQQQQQSGGIVVDPIALVVFVLVLVAGLCVVVLYATGAIGGKKKQ